MRGLPRGKWIHVSCKRSDLAFAHRMQSVRTGIEMRTLLLLSTMLLALAAQDCLAQSAGTAKAESEASAAQAVPAKAAAPKSAFGRVMGVLIAKLVQDSTQAAESQPEAGGTTLPIDVEVGAAFRPDASATAATETLPGTPRPARDAGGNVAPPHGTGLALQDAQVVAGH